MYTSHLYPDGVDEEYLIIFLDTNVVSDIITDLASSEVTNLVSRKLEQGF